MNCRWCDKSIIFYNDRWCHVTTEDQKLCPTPLPFEDQLRERELTEQRKKELNRKNGE